MSHNLSHTAAYGRVLPLIVAVISSVLPAAASPNENLLTTPVLDLPDPVVVTATRSERPLSQALASVSLIDRELIERSQAQDLFELLRLQAGVDIVRTGGPGAQTSVFLRGTNSNQVLVLIDGVRVASANSGLFQFENLPLEQIERIEIVRGPRASVFGSDAIGGVIQIFTRQAIAPALRVNYGSNDLFRASMSGGLDYRGGSVSGSISWRESNGFSAQNRDGFSFNPDNDGFENLGVNLRGFQQLGPGRLDWLALVTDAEVDFDEGVSDGAQQTFAIGYEFGSKRWRHETRISYHHDDLDSDFRFFTSHSNTERFQHAWLSSVGVTDELTLQAGIDTYVEWGENQGSFNQNRRNVGAFVLADWTPGRHAIDASFRIDDDEHFGTEATGQLAWGLDFAPGWQFSASYGRGFRAPTFNQLFSPGFGGQFAGNPDLEAETSDAVEAGLRFRRGIHRLSLNGFYQQIDELIDFSGLEFQAVNIAEAEITGLELDYQLQHPDWLLHATATLQDPENDRTGEKLLRRPDEKASLSLDRLFGDDSWFGVEVFYSGEAIDFGGVVLDDYVLVNLRAGYRIAHGWRLEARLDNIFDENYTQAFGFNTPGVTGFVALRWQP